MGGRDFAYRSQKTNEESWKSQPSKMKGFDLYTVGSKRRFSVFITQQPLWKIQEAIFHLIEDCSTVTGSSDVDVLE